jgi:predicted choloylglycine hydrolase
MSRMIDVTFRAFVEDWPDEKWLAYHRRDAGKWSDWLARNQSEKPASPLECRHAVATHLPRWLPVYDRMLAMVGASPEAARILSFWDSPPLISGCSVLALTSPEPALVRSYDFTESFFDGVVARTRWCGKRVVAMCEGVGGCLDGINEDGLVAALTFGGRFAHGQGFAIPIIVRYVLECCATVDEAIETLRGIPSSGVHNIILLDRTGATAVAFMRPDAPMGVSREAMTTNHQEHHEPGPALATSSQARKAKLKELQGTDLAAASGAFLQPPLHHHDFTGWFGTLYTAAYLPALGTARYFWPDSEWEQSINHFEEGERTHRFKDTASLETYAAK